MKLIFFNKYIVGIILLVLSESLMKTPFQNFSILLNLLITFFSGLLLFYFIISEVKKLKFKDYHIYIYLFILSLLPIMAAIKANIVFKQSIIDGIMGNTKFYNIFIFFYFFYLYKYKKNATKIIKDAVILLAWVILILYYIIRITLPDYRIEFNSFDGVTYYNYGVSTLGSSLFIWTAFFYFSKYVASRKNIYMVNFLLFIGYFVVFSNARTIVASLAIVIMWNFLKEFSTTLKVRFISFSLIIFSLLLISSSVFQPVKLFFEDKSELFQNAFEVIQGSEGEDVSANARLWQIETASRYIDHIWFGAGTLKSSTKSLYLSDYFYPEDIGLIGIVFNYGIIGLLILLYQIKIFSGFFKNEILKSDMFLNSTLYFLLFIYISSIFSGQFVFNIGFIFLLFSILYFEIKKASELVEIN